MAAATAKKSESPAAAGPLRWVHAPQQERSQKTLERLLDAAEELFARQGFEQTGVAEITQAARSSVGSFYARFADKQTLLRTLHERFNRQGLATARMALDPARWRGRRVFEIAHELVGFLIKIYSERGELLLAFQAHARADNEMARRMLATTDQVAELLGALMGERQGEITHPDPKRAVRFAMQIVFASLYERTHMGAIVPQDQRISDEVFASELARAFSAYLGAEV